MRKPDFFICANKDAAQLCGNRTDDQRLCFRYIDSTIPLLSKSKIKPLAIFCGCTVRFVSDLVVNTEDRFSHNAAQITNRQLHRVFTVNRVNISFPEYGSTDLPRPLSNNLWIIPSQKVDWDRVTFSIKKY